MNCAAADAAAADACAARTLPDAMAAAFVLWAWGKATALEAARNSGRSDRIEGIFAWVRDSVEL